MQHLAEFYSKAVAHPSGCYCLELDPKKRKTVYSHALLCPLKIIKKKPPVDITVYTQDPSFLHSKSFDSINSDAGFIRIDRFIAIINYIRRNVKGCEHFYSVTDHFLKHMYAQLLPVIVGDDRFNDCPSKYFEYANLSLVPVRSFTVTARQIGKTTTMAIMIAALACVAEGGPDFCKIYAVGAKQAMKLLTDVKNIYFNLPMTLRQQKVLKTNQSELSVVSTSNNQALTITAAPGNIEGIRGHNPRVIFVDEFQFTLPDFWTQHVFPLLSVENRILIAASTPGLAGSFMAAKTQEYKNAPQAYPAIRVLDFSLVCNAHRESNRPLECRCKLHLLPPWKSPASLKEKMLEYGDAKSADFVQEVLGEPVSCGKTIFDPRLIKACFEKTHEIGNNIQGDVIYVAIDPSGGGESELAITSILYMGDSRVLILGLESTLSFKMSANAMTDFVRKHLRKLRQMPALKDLLIVPIVESQGGISMAQTLCDVFRETEFQPITFLLSHKVNASCETEGVQTTKSIKENMVFLVENLLLSLRLLVWNNVFTTGIRNFNSPPNYNVENAKNVILTLLQSQMTKLYYDDKQHITGKAGDGYKDDLVMALFLAIYWSNFLRTKFSTMLVMGSRKRKYESDDDDNYYN